MPEPADADYELYQKISAQPDAECFILPASWYEKFNAPVPKAVNPREFINSGYVQQVAYAPKDLEPIVISEPQRGGFVYDVPAPAPMEVGPATVRYLEEATTGGEQTAEVITSSDCCP